MSSVSPYARVVAMYPHLLREARATPPTPAARPTWNLDEFQTFLDRMAPRSAATPPMVAPKPAGRAPLTGPFYVRKDSQSYGIYGMAGATWLADPKWDPTTAKRVAAEAKRLGQIPVFAQYDIPGRDLGGASAGGAKDLAAYRALVEATAAAIGDAPAVVVIEPDALAHGLNVEAVRAAVTAYRKHCPNARVYIDAGHAAWKGVAEMADLLVKAGIAGADGFALNVSNFEWTTTNMAYGDRLVAELARLDPALANKRYVIDTSRNGAGPGADEQGKRTWGDPVRALAGGPVMSGPKPTFETGNPNCAAFLWVKGPGYGDGRIHKSGFGGEAWVAHNPSPPLGPR